MTEDDQVRRLLADARHTEPMPGRRRRPGSTGCSPTSAPTARSGPRSPTSPRPAAGAASAPCSSPPRPSWSSASASTRWATCSRPAAATPAARTRRRLRTRPAPAVDARPLRAGGAQPAARRRQPSRRMPAGRVPGAGATGHLAGLRARGAAACAPRAPSCERYAALDGAATLREAAAARAGTGATATAVPVRYDGSPAVLVYRAAAGRHPGRRPVPLRPRRAVALDHAARALGACCRRLPAGTPAGRFLTYDRFYLCPAVRCRLPTFEESHPP